MSTHDELIRDIVDDLRESAAQSYEELSQATIDVLNRAADALESRPSLSVQSEEALREGIAARLAWASLHWEVSTSDMHREVARALIESGVVRVAPSLVAATRKVMIETIAPLLADRDWNDAGHILRGIWTKRAEEIVDALLAGPVRVVEVTAEQAWVSALDHVWELNDPAYSILPDTASRLPLVTEADVRQAKAENPYVGNSRKEARG